MADYEAIVIGSGSGGLTAALALARAGRRVAVFEQHNRLGGYTQSFDIGGFDFSPGVHYIGGLGPGGPLREIYEGLGIGGDLVFLELNPDGYDHVVVGGERFDIPKGRDAYVRRLKDRFPAEAAGIDGYFGVVTAMADEIGRGASADGVWNRALLPVRMPTVVRWGLRSLDRLLDEYTQDPLLRAILSIQAGDHGMAPSRAPAVLHAGMVSYYLDGAWYPRGGPNAIVEALASGVRAAGGETHVRTPVARILIEDGRARGVALADGSTVRADVVISDADPGVTWGRLVPPEAVGLALHRRLHRLRYSVSTVSLFLGLDMDLRAAGLDSGNCWLSRTTDVEAMWRFGARTDLDAADEIPGLFANATTLKDPSRRADGRHTMEAICLASYDAFVPWEDSVPGKRPDGYRRLKAHLKDKMLDAVETLVPGVRRHVEVAALGTPLTNRDLIAATRGAIYGTEKSLRNLGPLAFPIRTHVAGLFQCGASAGSPGILGVTTSGLLAAQAVLGVDRRQVLSARGAALQVLPAEQPERWPEALRPVRQNA